LLREAYEVNGQTAWSLLVKAETYRIVLVSELPDEQVASMRMIPARTLHDALSAGPSAGDGYILPRGGAVLPVIRD
jgi:hypothetical protein